MINLKCNKTIKNFNYKLIVKKIMIRLFETET